MNWLATVLGGVLLWFILEIAAEFLLEVATVATRPIRPLIWTAFMRAQLPWPAALLAAFGLACSFVGAQLLQRANAPKWAEGLGLFCFLGGALVMLAAPALWFEARKMRRQLEPSDAS